MRPAWKVDAQCHRGFDEEDRRGQDGTGEAVRKAILVSQMSLQPSETITRLSGGRPCPLPSSDDSVAEMTQATVIHTTAESQPETTTRSLVFLVLLQVHVHSASCMYSLCELGTGT